MLCSSRDKTLPSKVLKQIFQNFDRKEDIKTCLLVCKYWKSIAQEFFNRDISIEIKHKKKHAALMKDLPVFGQNIKALKLRPYNKFPRLDKRNKALWKNVLGFCPNITSIYVLKTRSILALLEALQDPALKFNNLQKIEAKELDSYSLKTQDFLLKANARYCETITSLRFYALRSSPRAIWREGLTKYISQFSRLTCLKINSPFSSESIGINRRCNPEFIVDIKDLLEVAPQLKEVKLYDCDITTSIRQHKNQAQITERISLTNLKIKSDWISTCVVKYIVTLLKEVKYLYLITNATIVDEFVSEEEFETVLNDLKKYMSKMETVKIKYKYNGQDFYSNDGKKFYCNMAIKDEDYDDNFATDSSSGDDDGNSTFNSYRYEDSDEEYSDEYYFGYEYCSD